MKTEAKGFTPWAASMYGKECRRLYLFDAPFDHASLQKKYCCAVPLAAVFRILTVNKVLVPIAKYEKKDYKISVDLVL